jgi:hypothetical protein
MVGPLILLSPAGCYAESRWWASRNYPTEVSYMQVMNDKEHEVIEILHG